MDYVQNGKKNMLQAFNNLDKYFMNESKRSYESEVKFFFFDACGILGKLAHSAF